MTNFAFAGLLYRNSAEMHAAIAEAWLAPDPENGMSAEDLADEVIEGWRLGEPDDPHDPDSDPSPVEFDRDELIAAFRKLAACRPTIAPPKTEDHNMRTGERVAYTRGALFDPRFDSGSRGAKPTSKPPAKTRRTRDEL